MRKNNWKLVAARGKSWELYNLKKDRTETNNLVREYQQKVARMNEIYNKWARRVGARTNKEAKNMKVSTQNRLPSYLRNKKAEEAN